jgi:uncharacterized phage-like protein YoqJ
MEEHREYLLRKLYSGIEYAYGQDCRDFLSGAALGFDMMAAEAVLDFKKTHSDARLVMVLPCRDQDARWNIGERKRYAKILSSADEIIYIKDVYTDTCMRERNAYLAKHCDILLAYLYREKSGASQTVRMAKTLGKRVYNLCPRPELI